MKYINIFSIAVIIAAFAACSPSEKRVELPAIIDKSQLKFSVTQNPSHDNVAYLNSQTPNASPSWSFGTSFSTRVKDTVLLPFGGANVIKYGVISGGGFVQDSVKINVTKNDDEFFANPNWNLLTNGQAGKTWVLDMVNPMGFYGLDWGKGGSGDWSWEPDLASNSWIMPSRDYGEIKFDLNGNFNYTKISKDAAGNASTCVGTFSYDFANKLINLNGCELLFGGDYHRAVANWNQVKVIRLTANEVVLGVIRTVDPCYLGFRFKPKQ